MKNEKSLNTNSTSKPDHYPFLVTSYYSLYVFSFVFPNLPVHAQLFLVVPVSTHLCVNSKNNCYITDVTISCNKQSSYGEKNFSKNLYFSSHKNK